jgi:hypothetical protein
MWGRLFCLPSRYLNFFPRGKLAGAWILSLSSTVSSSWIHGAIPLQQLICLWYGAKLGTEWQGIVHVHLQYFCCSIWVHHQLKGGYFAVSRAISRDVKTCIQDVTEFFPINFFIRLQYTWINFSQPTIFIYGLIRLLDMDFSRWRPIFNSGWLHMRVFMNEVALKQSFLKVSSVFPC